MKRNASSYFLAALLSIEVLLLASEQFQWFAFNERKGWTVSIAVGVVCACMLPFCLRLVVLFAWRAKCQISVVSLLLFVAVLAIPFAWLNHSLLAARRQTDAIVALGQCGAQLWLGPPNNCRYVDGKRFYPTIPCPRRECTPPAWEWMRDLLGDDFFVGVAFVTVYAPSFGDRGMQHIQCLTGIHKLELGGTCVTDHGLKCLAKQRELHVLSLTYTKVTDVGLAHLGRLRSLSELCLGGTAISDAGLAELADLPALEYLDLEWTPVGDEGMHQVGRMKALKRLVLTNTRVTDAGLDRLSALKNLGELEIYDTRITADGIARFQKTHPDCRINATYTVIESDVDASFLPVPSE